MVLVTHFVGVHFFAALWRGHHDAFGSFKDRVFRTTPGVGFVWAEGAEATSEQDLISTYSISELEIQG